MKKVLAALVLAAVAMPCAADGWKLTKEQQDKAEELGAMESPIAFLQACSMATERLSPEDQDEYDKSSKDEREQIDVLRLLTTQHCLGMIRAVAETVVAGAPYRVEGNEPICVDPERDLAGLLKVMIIQTKRNPSVADAPGMTTPLYILRSLQALSDCES